jgi:hypothetical protein
MFKLSSCIAVCRGRYFPSLSFCFDIRRPVLIARALCGLLNVTGEALYSSLAAVSPDVAGSAAYVYSVHVYPQSRDLNQIQSTLSIFTWSLLCRIVG